ncbi:MAG: NADH dehydrogenase [Mariniblastus sp.]
MGGGFGGLQAARALKRTDVDVTLVDRRNFHLFQPLLYQVATGGLSPANIASPIRSILRRQKNASVVLGEVVSVDPIQNSVEVHYWNPGDDQTQIKAISYDWLIVAAGATHSYFGHDEWEDLAPGLKTIEDATEIRGRVLSAFEAAEQEPDPQRRAELMTFVIVGGGPTGVELAGAIAELARRTLRDDFRNINPPDAKIMIVDGMERILANFAPELSHKAEVFLGRLGVELQTGTHVTAIRDDAVEISIGDEHSTLRTRTVLWAAGVAAVPLGRTLASATGVEADRGGRVPVQSDLSVTSHQDLFVIGDLASCRDAAGKPLPGVAQVAMQQGKYVGRLISNQVRGKPKPNPFAYKDKGSLATIGRSAAVADLGKMKFSGFFAWLLWLLVHIMSIVAFQNRVLIFFQWAWNFATFNRSARLITDSANLKQMPQQNEDESQLNS